MENANAGEYVFHCCVHYATGTVEEKDLKLLYGESNSSSSSGSSSKRRQDTETQLRNQLGVNADEVLLVHDDKSNVFLQLSKDLHMELLKNGCKIKVTTTKDMKEQELLFKRINRSKQASELDEQSTMAVVDSAKHADDVIAFLKVTVVEARNLAAIDTSAKTGVFVVFRMESSRWTFKTTAKYKTLNPIYNETCLLPITNMQSKLLVSVFDWHFGKFDHFIGGTAVDISITEDYKDHDTWYGITYKSQKKYRGEIRLNLKLKNKQEANRKVFGSPLHEVLLVGNQTHTIPLVVQQTLAVLESKALEVEGIGRLAGVASQVDEYKSAFDKDEPVDLFQCPSVHTVCALLKMYLRELPDPLISYDLYDLLIAAEEKGEPLSEVGEILNRLQLPNKALLKRLLIFFHKIAQNHEINKMTPHNIATVFAPTLMYPQVQVDLQQTVHHTSMINALWTRLIQGYDLLNLDLQNDMFLHLAWSAWKEKNPKRQSRTLIGSARMLEKDETGGLFVGKLSSIAENETTDGEGSLVIDSEQFKKLAAQFKESAHILEDSPFGTSQM